MPSFFKNYFRYTYRYEELFVAAVVVIPLLFSDRLRLSEIVAATAVFFTFKHACVADRMQERQAIKPVPDVECYRKSNRYFMIKEALWIAFFIMIKSWAALTGAFVFFLYPLWRKWYRRRHPLIQPA